MASVLEMLTTVGSLVESVVYPNGSANPSIIGKDVNIVLGVPIKKTLDEYLRTGNPFISINVVAKMGRNTTRYNRQWKTTNIPVPNMQISIIRTGTTQFDVVLSGTAVEEETLVLQPDNDAFRYEIVAGDTLDSVAAAMASLIPGATSIADTITIPGVNAVTGGISVMATASQEVKREQRVISVMLWLSDFNDRDFLGEAVDVYLSAIDRFVLPDDFYARIQYSGSYDRDEFQVHRLYKRELEYMIEYPTTNIKKFPTLVVTEVQLSNL